VGVLSPIAAHLSAQDGRPMDVSRAQATRSELTAGLAELEKVVASPGYSGNLRKAKQVEADMVRQRLTDGDFQVGDQIDISVVGEPALTGKFTVLPDRTIVLPQLPPISLRGILRSESRDYLTTQISKYVKDPQVLVQGSYIRIAVTGGVIRPGYYSLPADNLVSDAIMAAGGPGPGTDMSKSIVRRDKRELVTQEVVQQSLAAGQSLDQLNLHGGDELVVGGPGAGPSKESSWTKWIWPAQGVLSIILLITRPF
jgi:polysaccharide export outer membrane protein